jgi:hypothetical protein
MRMEELVCHLHHHEIKEKTRSAIKEMAMDLM